LAAVAGFVTQQLDYALLAKPLIEGRPHSG